MPIQNRVQGSIIFKIITQEVDKYMGYSPKENSNKQDLIQDELDSGISITLLIMRSSCIFSRR